MALIVLLQSVTPTQRGPVLDLLLDAPDGDQCLQAVKEFLAQH
ncbi:MAG: hypothetical protein R3C14_24205 [Caldilineaceae bacterium]